MRRGSGLAALACAAVLAGCGGDPAQDVLTETGQALGSVRSGTLVLEVVLGSQDDQDADTGFRLEGPFSLDAGQLPVMRMEYTRLVGPQQATVTLISTGDEAFVEVDGVAYALPPDRAAGLRREGGEGGLGALDLAEWAESPRLAEAPDDATTDTVTGGANLVAVLNDLFRLAGGLGAEGLGVPEGQEAESLKNAVTASSIEVVTRRDDRVLDRLAVRVDLGSTASLSEAGFPNLPGGRLRVDLALTDPGGNVQVEAPADPQPLDELPTPEATPTD